MTLYRAVFYTYKVITSHNLHLGNNSVVQAIGMEFSIMEAILKGQINKICINDVLKVSKLHDNLKVQFNLNECIVKSCNGEAIAITHANKTCTFYENARSKISQLVAISNGK